MDKSNPGAFLTNVDTGSFSKAGDELFLTQLAVIKRIATLEAQSGALIFSSGWQATFPAFQDDLPLNYLRRSS